MAAATLPADTSTLISALDKASIRSDRESSTTPEMKKTNFSSRARAKAASTGAVQRLSRMFDDLYDPETNPEGIISLGIAENTLMQDEMIEISRNALKSHFSSEHLSYGNMFAASIRLRSSLSKLYNRMFSPAEPVLPEHIVNGAGCSALLDQLFHVLLDHDEGVLLMSPYYAGYETSLVRRAGCHLIGVQCDDDPFGWAGPDGMQARMERALEEAKGKGITVKVVLVCNPHNPIGRTYPRETLLGYCAFAEKHDLQIVSDEIYALSVYDVANGNLPFTSMLSLNVESELGIPFTKGRLHVIHGMSKDFGANGFRIGCLISQNNVELRHLVQNTALLMKISSPSDVIWSTLLEDSRLDSYVKENQKRSADAHRFICQWFETRDIDVATANAGHFVWIDMRKRLQINTVEDEAAVFEKLWQNGVYVTAGTQCHNNIPGYYRITFTMPRDTLLLGLSRMEKVLGLSVPS